MKNPGNQYHDSAGRFTEAPEGMKRPRTGHLGYDPRKYHPKKTTEPAVTPAEPSPSPPAGYHGPSSEQLAELEKTFKRLNKRS